MLTFMVGCASENYFCDETGCYYCDGLGCREVDPPTRPGCLGDFECAAGTVCTDTGCAATCERNGDCAEGTECRDAVSICLGPTEPPPVLTPGDCTRNADCGASGLVCRDGMCIVDDVTCGDAGCDCSETATCSSGFTCLDGECRADEDTCQFNHECGEGRSCVDGRCTEGCGTAADCLSGQTCTDGFCRDIPPLTGECTADADCPGAGAICIDSTCFAGCTADTDCDAGRYCAEGTCRTDDRPRPFCIDDSECEPGHPCIGGICRTPCADNESCLRFDVQFNFCLEGFCATTNEATSDCAVTADCSDATDECIDGICR